MFNVIDIFSPFFRRILQFGSMSTTKTTRQMNSMKLKNMLMKRECIEIYLLRIHFAHSIQTIFDGTKNQKNVHLFHNYSDFSVLC